MAVRSWLESQADWLLVLDNADDLALFGLRQSVTDVDSHLNLMAFIPRGSQGSVLWTTRDQRAIGHLVGTSCGINVDGMTEDEAQELLTRLSGVATTIANSAYASAILERLERLPLAVSQAAAFIRATPGISYHQYCDRLTQERKRWRLLAKDNSTRYRVDGVPNNVMETWQITVDYLSQAHPLAHWMLMVVVYFHYRDIPWLLFNAVGQKWLQRRRHQSHSAMREEDSEQGASSEDEDDNDEDSDVEEDIVRTALGRLTQFSLIRAQTGSRQGMASYDIHPLVQDATRHAIWQESKRHTRPPIVPTAAETALSVLSQLFPSGVYETWPDYARLLTHILCLRQWPELKRDRFEMCDVLQCTSRYLHGQGRSSEAEEIQLQVLELRQEVLGEKHPDTIDSMSLLAAIHFQQRRLSKAEEVQTRVLELQREVLGVRHSDTFSNMANLATTYCQLGRLSKAEETSIQALELRREVLGEKHPDTIRSMTVLASIYFQQRRLSEAEEIQLRVLELQREFPDTKHPDTIHSMADLATTYYELGRLSEAEEIYMQVLALRREVLGERHPDTMRVMALLAAIYFQQRRLTEAEEIQMQALKLQIEVLGEKHPDTNDGIALLAAIYLKKDEQSEAGET